MLVRHRRIYTSWRGEATNALLIEGGRVVSIGAEALANAGGHEVAEPEGNCLFPALTDAHIHLWGLGLRAGSVSLKGLSSTELIYEQLASYELDSSPSGWVLGIDWDQNDWDDRAELSMDRLDSLWPDTPVCLRRVDGHAIWVNSKAFELAEIGPQWDPGEGGKVVVQDGVATGLLLDDAMDPIYEAMGPTSLAEDRATYSKSRDMLLGYGIAHAHMAWCPVDRIPMLESLRDSGDLGLRIHTLVNGNDEDLAELIDAGPRTDECLSIAGVKFFADGALGSRGALLLDTYPDGSKGLAIEARQTLLGRIPELARRGWQVAVHAIGDAAARNVLDAFAAVDARDRKATRPRLEHAQMLEDADLKRIADLGIIASVQPIHMHSDAAWAGEVLTDVQLKRLFRWHDLRAVAPLAFGSDYPIEDPNPWHGISVASSRLDKRGHVFQPLQGVSRPVALRAYTEGAAWAAHREHDLGQLKPGYLADFCVLDRDPFDSSDASIWRTRPLQTWVGGECLFSR